VSPLSSHIPKAPYIFTNKGRDDYTSYFGTRCCCSVREAIKNWAEVQHLRAWIDLPGLRHCKLFIGGPCKKRTDELPNLNRHQLKMVIAIYTGHAPVRGHLYTMGLFDGDPICSFCGWWLKQRRTLFDVARRWLDSVVMSVGG